MTIQEMRSKLIAYCGGRGCADCELWKNTLDYDHSGDACIPNSDDDAWIIERNYLLVFGNKDQEETEDSKGCESCKHVCKTEEDFPCNACKRDYAYSDERHWKHPDRWEPDEAEAKTDNVNHPAHYQGKHECIDEMIAIFGKHAVMDFCRCNVYKYRYRAAAKNGQEDLDKANWYMDKLIELKGESNDPF